MMRMYASIVAAEIYTVVKFRNDTQSKISENFREKSKHGIDSDMKQWWK